MVFHAFTDVSSTSNFDQTQVCSCHISRAWWKEHHFSATSSDKQTREKQTREKQTSNNPFYRRCLFAPLEILALSSVRPHIRISLILKTQKQNNSIRDVCSCAVLIQSLLEAVKASDCSKLISFVPDCRDAISTPSSCLPDGNGEEQEAPVRRPHPPRLHQRGQGRLQPHRGEQVGSGQKILESNHIPRNPPCSDGSTPTCTDGSDPIVRNNICQREEKQCPQGQGKAVSLVLVPVYILAG